MCFRCTVFEIDTTFFSFPNRSSRKNDVPDCLLDINFPAYFRRYDYFNLAFHSKHRLVIAIIYKLHLTFKPRLIILTLQIIPFSEEIYMNEYRYGILPFFLSLAALAISILFFTLPMLARSGIIADESFRQIWWSSIGLSLWGWIPGLVLAVITLGMLRRSRYLLRNIIVSSFSTIALIFSLIWASIAFDTLVHGPL